MEYASSETAQPIRFYSDSVPSCIAKYANILRNFTNYMDKNLRPSQEVSSGLQVNIIFEIYLNLFDLIIHYLGNEFDIALSATLAVALNRTDVFSE